MTLKFDGWPRKNNRAPRLCYPKLYASFRSHRLIQTGGTLRKHWFGLKSAIFCCVWPYNLKHDLEKIRHLFYATPSYVHHFIAISEFKLELQPGNAQTGQNGRFLSNVTLKFDGWHWETIGHLFYATLSFVHHFIDINEFKLELQSRNALLRQNWHLSYATSSFSYRFIAICEFKLELQSGNA